MKYGLLSILAIQILVIRAYGQKPALDTGILGKWPELHTPMISNDGQYSLYVVSDRKAGMDTLHVVSNGVQWQVAVVGVISRIVFSDNSQWVYFMNGHDSLGIIRVGKEGIAYRSHVRSYKLSPEGKQRQWLACVGSGTEERMTVEEVSGGQQRSMDGVQDYAFSSWGQVMVVERKETVTGGKGMRSLEWLDLLSGEEKRIWRGDLAQVFSFSDSGHQLAFQVLQGASGKQQVSICYYREGMDSVRCLLWNGMRGLEKGFIVNATWLEFSRDGRRVLMSLVRPVVDSSKLPEGASDVYVWNYKDRYLQPGQLSPSFFSNVRMPRFWVVCDVASGKLIRLNEADEALIEGNAFGRYVLVRSNDYLIAPYDKGLHRHVSLVSTEDGQRVDLVEGKIPGLLRESPDDRFVVWFDVDSLRMYSYDKESGKRTDLSKGIPVVLDDSAAGRSKQSVRLEVAGWETEGHFMYLYDRYDIWKVDLLGQVSPVNITRSYGRTHHIVFGVINFDPATDGQVIHPGEEVVLEGFDEQSKDNGFWVVDAEGKRGPEKRTMGPYAYCILRLGQIGEAAPTSIPKKARDRQRFLVCRRAASEFPNVYVTDDLISYRQLSRLNPEKRYNWMRTELVRWQLPDGRYSEGVLYKPEDFDTTRRYPVLFTYYERMSANLHGYERPELCQGRIDIAYFVSNGYLVFTPDIYYRQGHNGQSVVEALGSAAKYLSRYRWVDPARMGITGHSFGGWETNYLVTHTHCFAAACTAAGPADLVSEYDEGDNYFGQSYLEFGSAGSPYGVGVTPWTRPDLYIENSPIFSLDSVTTPLLIMQGDKDKSTPYEQAREMFLGLKRAGKKVWLLQYAQGGHVLNGKDAMDLTIRVKQFFDYYLKGQRPPMWMTEGVPAKIRGGVNGLELDKSGAIP